MGKNCAQLVQMTVHKMSLKSVQLVDRYESFLSSLPCLFINRTLCTGLYTTIGGYVSTGITMKRTDRIGPFSLFSTPLITTTTTIYIIRKEQQ